jgi:tetratricopeptide (TPR) repeat protein
MSHTDSAGNPTGDSYRDAGVDFESGVRHARFLIEKGKIERALEVLSGLEERYVRATAVFDALGDAFLANGDVSQGIRYKTLHQILKGTFRIVSEENAERRLPIAESSYDPRESVAQTAGDAIRTAAVVPSEDEGIDEVVPVTLSMAQELMRQGHYDRAAGILENLVRQSPDDDALKDLRGSARRKTRDRKLLEIFQRWLKNIEQMKSGESVES